MLKLKKCFRSTHGGGQPPLGGCVLKRDYRNNPKRQPIPAAFRRLCVETVKRASLDLTRSQPPLGGCVLKLLKNSTENGEFKHPAAFRRLCVETGCQRPSRISGQPAAFRRLCVETIVDNFKIIGVEPAAFRRLCVETVKPF